MQCGKAQSLRGPAGAWGVLRLASREIYGFSRSPKAQEASLPHALPKAHEASLPHVFSQIFETVRFQIHHDHQVCLEMYHVSITFLVPLLYPWDSRGTDTPGYVEQSYLFDLFCALHLVQISILFELGRNQEDVT